MESGKNLVGASFSGSPPDPWQRPSDQRPLIVVSSSFVDGIFSAPPSHRTHRSQSSDHRKGGNQSYAHGNLREVANHSFEGPTWRIPTPIIPSKKAFSGPMLLPKGFLRSHLIGLTCEPRRRKKKRRGFHSWI